MILYSVAPSPVGSIDIQTGKRQLTITWTEPTEPNGVIEEYNIVVSSVDGNIYKNVSIT